VRRGARHRSAHPRHDHRRHGPLCRHRGRLRVRLAVRAADRGRRDPRAGRRVEGPLSPPSRCARPRGAGFLRVSHSDSVKRVAVLAFGAALWWAPPPEGLLREPWHLFAIFVTAIAAVILDAFPLMTAAVLAAAATVLTGTAAAAKVFSGFANGSVL